MQESIATDAIDSTAQSEITNVRMNNSCLLRSHRDLLTNGVGERRHIGT